MRRGREGGREGGSGRERRGREGGEGEREGGRGRERERERERVTCQPGGSQVGYRSHVVPVFETLKMSCQYLSLKKGSRFAVSCQYHISLNYMMFTRFLTEISDKINV